MNLVVISGKLLSRGQPTEVIASTRGRERVSIVVGFCIEVEHLATGFTKPPLKAPYISCSAWDDQAESLRVIPDGRRVIVTGHFKYRPEGICIVASTIEQLAGNAPTNTEGWR